MEACEKLAQKSSVRCAQHGAVLVYGNDILYGEPNRYYRPQGYEEGSYKGGKSFGGDERCLLHASC